MESPNDISKRTGDNLARPLLKAYPKHMDGKSHGRSFVASWYERYSWMEYSQDFDAVFCFPCRHFCPPGYCNAEEAFTKTGFRRWKKAHGKDGAITKHVNSQCHKMSIMSWNDYNRNKAAKTSVEQVLNESYHKKVNENCHYVKTFGEIILLTATQNSAQRGHREGEDVSNRGNVKKILQFAAKHDPVIANRIKQLSVVIRFFAKESKNIQECFLIFIPMEALNAESIRKATLGKLEQMGLDYKGCLVGMGIDGASVMCGKLGGVQKLIKDKSLMAYYLLCYAHRLNLVLIDTTKVVDLDYIR